MRMWIAMLLLTGCELAFPLEAPPIGIRTTKTTSVISSDTISIPRPPELLDGDIALVQINVPALVLTASPPGWTEVFNDLLSSACSPIGLQTILYSGRVESDDTRWDFTLAGNGQASLDALLLGVTGTDIAVASAQRGIVNTDTADVNVAFTAFEVPERALVVLATNALNNPTAAPGTTRIIQVDKQELFELPIVDGQAPALDLVVPGIDCAHLVELTFPPKA